MPEIGRLIDATDAPAAVRQGLGMAVSAALGGGVGGMQGAASAFNTDTNNRQLHPSEIEWLKSKAKDFARQEGLTEQIAAERLTQQALREVDYLWRAQLSDGDDIRAKEFLATAKQSFINTLGEQQILFTTAGSQLMRPEMFAEMAHPYFYQQFAQSGITRQLNDGLLKELKDSGIDIKNQAINLAKAVSDNPMIAVNAVWDTIKHLPQSIVDALTESGTAIGEGLAVTLTPALSEKINAIYGTDVTNAQKAILTIRLATAIAGAAGTAKATSNIADTTTAALAKKLDDVLDQQALETLLRSGGVHDTAGHSILDLKQLSSAQKGVIGDLMGANTVRQLIPGGQKIARIPVIGETGIDDLYKVKRTDVDYVVIEYKFVGQNGRTGAQALASTKDGRQGSTGWVQGGNRLFRAVGEEETESILLAYQANRVETWVVTTRADGATEVQLLDAAGKPKNTRTSLLLPKRNNLSGARQ
jgi:filamentous hemagglutinin